MLYDPEIHEATPGDALMIYEATNDPVAVEFSIRREIFTLEQHMDWFRERLADPNTVMLVNSNLGYVRYGRVRSGSPLWTGGPRSERDGPIEVTIAVHPKARGMRVATHLLTNTAQYATIRLGHVPIYALVRLENTWSHRLFTACGYRADGWEDRFNARLLRYRNENVL